MIKFLDLQAAYLELKPELDTAVARVLGSGWYVLGPEVDAFESEFAAFVGAAGCVGVGNGLDAMVLALRALDIGPGDEVLVPSNTYIATWLAVSIVGATPVPVEPEPDTFCIDPARVEAAITPRTKAILPVHLYGHAAQTDVLWGICQRHGLRMVEDAAQAHGAEVAGKPIGGAGDVVAWSFYPGKNLGAFGDAGAVTAQDTAVLERIAMLRNYGSAVKYINVEKGLNSRLDPLQAAVLRVKLPFLAEWNARREQVAQLYSRRFSGLPLGLPGARDGTSHAWHLYVLTTPRRDELQAHLNQAGIGTLIHYPIPPFRQQAYSEFESRSAEWPIADRIANEVLSLPIGPHLALSQADAVADAVVDFFNH